MSCYVYTLLVHIDIGAHLDSVADSESSTAELTGNVTMLRILVGVSLMLLWLLSSSYNMLIAIIIIAKLSNQYLHAI